MPGYNITISDSRISKQIYELQKAVARISSVGGGGGGTGTVTNVSVGDLSPLFTSSTDTPSTTASTSFILTSQNPNTFFAGPSSGISATPTFRSLTSADFPLSGVSANTYNNVVVNNKGIVTGGSNVAYLTANQPITITGDFTGGGTTSISATLNTVNTNVGTFNNSTVTVDEKGRVLSVSEGTAVSSAGVVNVVTDYGADNTGTIDATAAINNAINNGSKYKIYLPAGTYLITAVYLKSSSGTNKQGIQLINNIELYGDGIGKTIIKLQDAASASTTNSYFYPIINGLNSITTAIIHDIEINGNKANQGNYIDDPYTNPAGYYADPANRWSTPAIMFMNGDRNEVYNVYAHDSQLNGVYTYNSTNTYTHHCRMEANGGSGVVYHHLSTGFTGVIDNVLATTNKSDQIRIDDCPGGGIIRNCEASWAGTSATAPNWMAGIYMGGTITSNVLIDGCYVHDNSAYGIDLGESTSCRLINNRVEYNGNGGFVLSNDHVIINNMIDSNGKRSDGGTDTHSNYNPAAIVIHSGTRLVIQGNKSFNTNAAQLYFIKSWGGGGSTGFNSSTVMGNVIKGVADVAHMYDGNDGTNTIIGNRVYSASNVLKSYEYMSNTVLAPDNYITVNGSVSTGDTTVVRIGSNNANDGIFNVCTSLNNKLLQYGGLALSFLGSYNAQGWANNIAQGGAIGTGNSLTWKITTATGDCFLTGGLAVGTSTPDSKAALTVSSTTKGFLPPKMTTTQRDAITSPTEGLTLYNTTTHKLEVYDGTIWQACF